MAPRAVNRLTSCGTPQNRAKVAQGMRGRGDLEQRRPDPPALAQQRPGQVDARRAQVLAEAARRELAVELALPPVGVLLAVGVDRLALAAVVAAVEPARRRRGRAASTATRPSTGRLSMPLRPDAAAGDVEQLQADDADGEDAPGHFFPAGSAELDSAATKASCGTSTRPTIFIRFLPSFCFSSSLRLRVMSPP